MVDGNQLEEYGFDPASQRRAREYHSSNLRLDLFQTIVTLVVLLIFAWFGSKHLSNLVHRYVSPNWLSQVTYVACVSTVFGLIELPFSYLGFRIEDRFDLSNQEIPSWLVDEAKSAAISFLLSLVILPVIFTLMEVSDLWWIWSWAVLNGLTMILGYITPTFLMPLFYDFEELQDEDFSQRLNALAEAAGVEVVGAFKMGAEEKTKRAVGGLTGFGSTRRIILSDTLLDNFTEEEVEGVIAHELGHHIYNDMWRNLAINAVSTFLGLYAVHISLPVIAEFFNLGAGIESLPLLLIIVGGIFFLLEPFQNTLSRRMESRADRYALRLVDSPGSLASAFVKLAERNLSVADPEPWREKLFYDHPSPIKRVKRAKSYESRS